MQALIAFAKSKQLAARAAVIAGLAFSVLAMSSLALSSLALSSLGSTAAQAQTSASQPPAAASGAQAPADSNGNSGVSNPGAGSQDGNPGPGAGGNSSEASPIKAEWLQVLQNAGSFFNHERYGEVWKPAVTPQGWHPYPACYWKNTQKFGWYFDDPTDWGKIVHHYGRWTNDIQHGWIWVPGKEFSPGWVVWRTSNEYIGWSPQMPDQDLKVITRAQFNKSGQWIFMDAKKFGKKCTEILPASQAPAVLQKTKFVTDVRFVEGTAYYVLPDIFAGPFINIDITYDPWPAWFFIQHILNLNWIWTNVNIIIINPCGP